MVPQTEIKRLERENILAAVDLGPANAQVNTPNAQILEMAALIAPRPFMVERGHRDQ